LTCDLSDFKNIPTNIISGFLGAGKTTVIQYLLNNKPTSEVWAVIVNEFGQVGVDAALLKNDKVTIKEIPGGCLCCVGSQSLNVGLNRIIRSVKPQRILIEPTGLGHPKKIIDLLTGEFYKSVLNVKAVINLVDAKNLNNARYLNNATFVEQSKLADILIATKRDTYSEDDINCFFKYAMSFQPEKIEVTMIEQGRLQLECLDFKRLINYSDESNSADFSRNHSHQHVESEMGNESDREVLQGWEMLQGMSEGFYSVSWKISNLTVFNKNKILSFLAQLRNETGVERVKGVIKTNKGWNSMNLTRYDSEILSVGEHTDSILEVISEKLLALKELNAILLKCCN